MVRLWLSAPLFSGRSTRDTISIQSPLYHPRESGKLSVQCVQIDIRHVHVHACTCVASHLCNYMYICMYIIHVKTSVSPLSPPPLSLSSAGPPTPTIFGCSQAPSPGKMQGGLFLERNLPARSVRWTPLHLQMVGVAKP